MIGTHLVYHPAFLNVKVLPRHKKLEIRDRYNDFFARLEKKYGPQSEYFQSAEGVQRLKGLVDFMLSEDWSRRLPETKEYLLRLDALRGTSFTDTFPELAHGLFNDEPCDWKEFFAKHPPIKPTKRGSSTSRLIRQIRDDE